jgi:hypothetical protein
MPYCTIVEFDWAGHEDRQGFELAAGQLDTDGALPPGCISRIASVDEQGARVIEVWESGGDARKFAESAAPSLAAASMPEPSRVSGFDVTSYRMA